LQNGERAPIGGPAKDIHNLCMVAAADDIPVIPVTTATLQSFCTDFLGSVTILEPHSMSRRFRPAGTRPISGLLKYSRMAGVLFMRAM
jgi:hypothetical protein